MPRVYAFLGSLAGKVLLAVVALLIVWFLYSSYFGAKEKAAQSAQVAREATASSEVAIIAAQAAIEKADKDANLDELVRETQETIDNATDYKISHAAAASTICGMYDDSSKPDGC